MKTIVQKLKDLKACHEAVAWVAKQKGQPLKRIWNRCPRGDWMWWLLMFAPGAMPTKRQSVAFARWCAERAKKCGAYTTDTTDAADAAWAWAYAAVSSADAAAAYAARAYAAAYAARAYADERLAQADYIRKHFACPVLP